MALDTFKPMGFAVVLAAASAAARADDAFFRGSVAPILEARCITCHNATAKKGGLSLESAAGLKAGSAKSGAVVVPGKPDESKIIQMVAGDTPKMPKKGSPLNAAEVDVLRKWVEGGAEFPADVTLTDKFTVDSEWWSLRPLRRPDVPRILDVATPQVAIPVGDSTRRAANPIDSFIRAKLRELGMNPSPPADKRALIRRVYFDVTGLPPSPEEVEAFVSDPDPRSYEKLVDKLLDTPAYGERWARHWLDVVHYGDTHGYDKDKVRPNAWPYRDYVIRSLNNDKPYAQFVKEQLAGDALYPGSDGVVALGFISAGPWDFVGHVELGEEKLDGKIARNLNRDDMVANAVSTFVSLTAHCARCHNHKFDPITQEDYYSLQAVFAAVDRADRPYDADPAVSARRVALQTLRDQLQAKRDSRYGKLVGLTDGKLQQLDTKVAEAQRDAVNSGAPRPEYGYHSAIDAKPDATKWVQVDLARSVEIAHVFLVGCNDSFNNIGPGFGFPVRFRIEASDDPLFQKDVKVIADHSAEDYANPGVQPRGFAAKETKTRYVRVTATKLAPRQNDYIFALAELTVVTPGQENAAMGAVVTSLDSIEAPVRWRRANLTDGIYDTSGSTDPNPRVAELQKERDALVAKVQTPEMGRESAETEKELRRVTTELGALPPGQMVYAAATHFSPSGGLVPTLGKPRVIRVLNRGEVKQPLQVVTPGTVSAVSWMESRFTLPPDAPESLRRVALAEWIVSRDNPLTWRSIVNRVWQYHFGRGIVESANDFGRMGSLPSHPELLDWLAAGFRDDPRQSLKSLHRLILTSDTYKQSSAGNAENAKIDGSNRYLWRMNRSRLEAEPLRDTVLQLAGRLDRTMGGPGFMAFGFKDDHSPHYLYEEADPDDVKSHRRSVYRLIVRSVPDPWMTTLDCADPSISVEKRSETITALQALALLNNRFMVRMAEHFAARVQGMEKELPGQVDAAFKLALGRAPTPEEARTLVKIAQEHGMANVCRLIFNMNEFAFVD